MKLTITETVGEVALTYAVEYEEHQAEEALIQLVDFYDLMCDPEPEAESFEKMLLVAAERIDKGDLVTIDCNGYVSRFVGVPLR